MDQPKQKVKIPCNHPLEYIQLKGGGWPGSYDYDINTCAGCDEDYGFCYYCASCSFRAHSECIEWPDTIDHPSHSRHPLKKVSPGTIDYTDGKCHFCREELVDPMYHCSLCNFSVDVNCWRHPPQRTIYQPKSHEHTFTLMPRKITFTCNACGMLDCIDLPRVININRHDHRISRTYHLGHGDWDLCGLCRKEIDWSFGAFTCKRCPSYAVHSKCAVRKDVWDGEELEDVPEEEEEIEDPYKVINDKEIIHFSHEEHSLRLGGDDNVTGYEKMLCDACITPISSDPFFKCVQCEFFLHKECASLPRRKRSILHIDKLDLRVKNKAGNHYKCRSCQKLFDGFRYKTTFDKFDVRCGSISEPFHHELHPHPLYHIFSPEEKSHICGACDRPTQYVLSCTVCEFHLGMDCGTLPTKVKHTCDGHDLSLHHGAGNTDGPLWCDICEEETDPSVWFYGCDDCVSTLHIKCVLGDMYHFKPGNKYGKAELVANDGMTRPFCIVCEERCMFPSFLKATVSDSTLVYACSMNCAYDSYWKKWYYDESG
ncbi:hypothetical protein [Arabidopsis thaliana]|uniref:Cysteine/Histidine-rich C1 domain family protein n=1 Tax=Arabidopsis thaliana TaxID=3702 RepID=Q9M900_ARATH|nr:Cysteine/Histidine-rich C1 domain family protein [Arabidopsis thaliana]AAF27003.1 hypothetical protein [Arabidopsis thaliana]AEE74485.1 Cysteine/Histidine-rich C1 domain family protein [Arabidopsis thaliana]|eukprot:NP_187355.1 Cysteine/Histidine-rich C1 domain family protein [Arabidopsis thaliana]